MIRLSIPCKSPLYIDFTLVFVRWSESSASEYPVTLNYNISLEADPSISISRIIPPSKNENIIIIIMLAYCTGTGIDRASCIERVGDYVPQSFSITGISKGIFILLLRRKNLSINVLITYIVLLVPHCL